MGSRKNKESPLSKKKLQQVFDSISDGVSIQDLEGTIIAANDSVGKILNLSKEEIIGRRCYELLPCRKGLYGDSASILRCPLVCKQVKKDGLEGEAFWEDLNKYLWIKIVPLYEDGKLGHIMLQIRDITRLETVEKNLSKTKRKERKLKQEVLLDPLTGLGNRRFFEEVVKKELRGRSYQGKICLLVMDINNFKKVNDYYGHATGDRVLKVFARVLSSSLRREDFAFRIGGDEFMVILRRGEGWEEVVERIGRKFGLWLEDESSSFDIPPRLKKWVNISYGFSLWDAQSGESIEGALSKADKKMYLDKKKKKRLLQRFIPKYGSKTI